MALIPTLGEQILEDMDVESITQELQSRVPIKSSPPQTPSESSLASSIDLIQRGDIDARSESHSVSSASFSGSVSVQDEEADRLGESSQSWAEQFSSSSSRQAHGSLPFPPDALVLPTAGNSALSDSYVSGDGAVRYLQIY